MPTNNRSWWIGSYGECECGMIFEGRNAVGTAANHARATGHECSVEVTRVVAFNHPDNDESEPEKE